MADHDKTAKKVCFVVGPIGQATSETRKHADWLYFEVIKRVLENFPTYEPIRADEIAAPGMIDGQIISHLVNDDLVIADLSFLNPNAFYEIGIRHAMKKPIIHMQRKLDTLPFDVTQFRAISFSMDSPQELNEARAELRKSIEAVQRGDFQIDNPFVRAGAIASLMASAPPADRFLLEELEKLRSVVSEIQQANKKKQIETDDAPALHLFESAGPKTQKEMRGCSAQLEITLGGLDRHEVGKWIVETAYDLTNLYVIWGVHQDKLFVGIPGIVGAAASDSLREIGEAANKHFKVTTRIRRIAKRAG